jgi:transcriptional regulator of arginine metabolism
MKSTDHNTDAKSRLEALRDLLSEGTMSSQEELREKLERMDFAVTQSTVSRDLRKLGAVKAIDPDGRTVYRLGDEAPAPLVASSLADLVIDIQHNLSMIVIHTTPGSASLIARHLDHYKPAEILGTIAGDDTIFVAPAAQRDVRETIDGIQRSFESAS